MDIKLFRRENGHLKGILTLMIFVISFLMWYFTDKAVVFYAFAKNSFVFHRYEKFELLI